jgi:hypothetical protein
LTAHLGRLDEEVSKPQDGLVRPVGIMPQSRSVCNAVTILAEGRSALAAQPNARSIGEQPYWFAAVAIQKSEAPERINL